MCAFWKKLGEAVKEIDKLATELGAEKESSQELPEEQTVPSEGLDMRQILTLAEVARLTGLRFDTYNDYLDDTWKGGVYTCSDPKIHKHFHAYFERKDPEGHDAGGIWNYLLEVMPNPQPVQGIGDEAYWSDVTKGFIVREGQNVLQAGGGLPLNIITQLVTIILQKVASAYS